MPAADSPYYYKINAKAVEKAINKAGARGVKAGLLRAGLRVEKESRDRAPVDTTSLQDSITSQWNRDRRFLGDGYVRVGPNVKSEDGAPYDLFQELGTGIHGPRHQPIFPRRKPRLRFKLKDGGWRSSKSVQGVKPVKYMEKGLKATPVDDEFVKGFNSVP
jgi:hypothetical protein